MSNKRISGSLVGGIILIVLGLLSLFGQIFRGFPFLSYLWPFIIIGFGGLFFVGMLAGGRSMAGLAIPGEVRGRLALPRGGVEVGGDAAGRSGHTAPAVAKTEWMLLSGLAGCQMETASEGTEVRPASIHGRSVPPILALTPAIGVQETPRECRGSV